MTLDRVEVGTTSFRLDLKFSPSNPRWRTDVDVYAIKRFSRNRNGKQKVYADSRRTFLSRLPLPNKLPRGVSEPHVPPHFCYFNSDEFNPTYRRPPTSSAKPLAVRPRAISTDAKTRRSFEVADYAVRNNGLNVRKRVDVSPWRRTVSAVYVTCNERSAEWR